MRAYSLKLDLTIIERRKGRQIGRRFTWRLRGEGTLHDSGSGRGLSCQVRQDDRDGWNGELETRKRPPYIPIPPAADPTLLSTISTAVTTACFLEDCGCACATAVTMLLNFYSKYSLLRRLRRSRSYCGCRIHAVTMTLHYCGVRRGGRNYS